MDSTSTPTAPLRLPDTFYAWPHLASTTMRRKELADLLLATDGWIMSHGRLWDIESKSLGAGVYRVSLKERA
jgi:hypothetical protein